MNKKQRLSILLLMYSLLYMIPITITVYCLMKLAFHKGLISAMYLVVFIIFSLITIVGYAPIHDLIQELKEYNKNKKL